MKGERTMADLSIDQRPEGWCKAAESYDSSFGSFTALFAQDAVRLANVGPGHRVLDVGTGTGAFALTAEQAGAEVLAVDFSQGMIDCLNTKIDQKGLSRIHAVKMDGQALDIENNSYDSVFSVFGLCFFPDRIAGFRELYRVLKPGGLGVVVNWCALEHSQFLRVIVGALVKAIPNLPAPSAPPPGLSLADPNVLKSEMRQGGFSGINLFTVRHLWTFPGPQVVYDSLASVQPMIARIFEMAGDASRQAFRSAIIQMIRDEQGNGPYGLEGEARIAVGTK
jgi:SAM-dependent methyltransferase